MKLAFCLFNYFPYGGLQRDFLRIATACQARGHDIHVYTMRWEGEAAPGFTIHLMKAKGLTNHAQCAYFANQVKTCLDAEKYHLTIGFNKMPYLDIYYAADVCYQSRVQQQRNKIYRLLPRYRQLVALEKAVFERGKLTEIMLIAAQQQPEYIRHYQTEEHRFHLLPPGISKDRMAAPGAAAVRANLRNTYQLSENDVLLLMVGSGFKTKGLDRVLMGIAALPIAIKDRCHLLVIGQDNPRPFKKLAKQQKIDHQVQFLGGRPDVADFYLAADLLVHPAYHENTGTVLLEALVAGLPVLTNEVCGYAHYVSSAKAGVVLPSPYSQPEFNDVLQKMVISPERQQWRENGLAFAQSADIYSMPEKMADLIEQFT